MDITDFSIHLPSCAGTFRQIPRIIRFAALLWYFRGIISGVLQKISHTI